jgi:hypothetical protein
MTQKSIIPLLAAFRRSILASFIAIIPAFFACSNGNDDETPPFSSVGDYDANASTIKASGDTLLVTLQRLENWAATKPGLLVRIKVSTKTIIDTIQLKFYNPGSSILSDKKLYVSSQKYNEDYSVDLAKSGVEVVDLATGISEILATGMELGGGANGIALNKASQILYASVYEHYGSAPVKPINLSSKSIGTALPDIADSFNGLVFDDESKKLFIADASGLKIYNTTTQTTSAVDEGENALSPYSLAITNSLLLNFTSDYTTGELRWMALNSTSLSAGTLSFHQDSKISTAEENIFILERAPIGNLSCILSQNIGNISQIKQKRLEADNPYEVAVIGNKGYIVLNDANYVQVFDISTCTLSEKINLPFTRTDS